MRTANLKFFLLSSSLVSLCSVFFIFRWMAESSLLRSLLTRAHPVTDRDVQIFFLALGCLGLAAWAKIRPRPKEGESALAKGAPLPEINGMRALAAVLIILFHWQPYGNFYFFSTRPPIRWEGSIAQWGSDLANGFFQLGYLAVGLFIIISGFGLAFGYYGQGGGRIKGYWKGFFLKRGMRVLPLYWTAVIVSFLFASYGGERVTLQGAIAACTLLSSCYRPWYGELGLANPPLWFIAVILALYGLFPFLMMLYRRLDSRLYLILLLGFSVVYHNTFVWNLPWGRVGEFGFGIVLGIYSRQHPQELRRFLTGFPVALLSAAALGFLVYLSVNGLRPGLVQPVLPVLIFLVLWNLVGLLYRIKPLIKILTWCAYGSYGAYLFHFLFQKWLAPVFEPHRRNPLGGLLFTGGVFLISFAVMYADARLRKKLSRFAREDRQDGECVKTRPSGPYGSARRSMKKG